MKLPIMVKDDGGLIVMVLDTCRVTGFCLFVAGFLLCGMQTVCLFFVVNETASLGYFNKSLDHDAVFENGACHNIPFLNIYLTMVSCFSLSLALYYKATHTISNLVALGWCLECIFIFCLQMGCTIEFSVKPSTNLEEGLYILSRVCKEPVIYHVNLFITLVILLAMVYNFTLSRAVSPKSVI